MPAPEGDRLDVYDTRARPWNPDHGDIEIPEDCERPPTGDPFVTRDRQGRRAVLAGLEPSDAAVDVRGRTKKLDLEERAALAAKAYIRHRFSAYEDDLVDQAVWNDDLLYCDVKAAAQEAVAEFLAQHRRRRP